MVGIIIWGKSHFTFALAKTTLIAIGFQTIADWGNLVEESQKDSKGTKKFAKRTIYQKRQKKYNWKSKQFDKKEKSMEIFFIGHKYCWN